MTPDQSTILLVDDDPQVLEVYQEFLKTHYIVKTANDGSEALDLLNDDIDLIVLDRRMPGLSGDEVLEKVRAKGFDCPVLMVTAIDPGVDIITMSFNDYLVKPVSEQELLETVEHALDLAERDVQMQEFFSLKAKQSTLESEIHASELDSNDQYQQLKDRIAELRDRIDPPIADFEEDLANQLSEQP